MSATQRRLRRFFLNTACVWVKLTEARSTSAQYYRPCINARRIMMARAQVLVDRVASGFEVTLNDGGHGAEGRSLDIDPILPLPAPDMRASSRVSVHSR